LAADPTGYFGRVSKQQALDAVAEGVTRQAADNLAKLKKNALAKEAEKQLAGTGWLPAILRVAS
jgi:ParB family chromosome partitioning protein